MNSIGVVSIEQSVVNQSDLSTQKKSDIVKTRVTQTEHTATTGQAPQIQELNGKIKQIAGQLKTEVENKSVANESDSQSAKLSTYYNSLIDELTKVRTELAQQQGSDPSKNVNYIGEWPVYPFDQNFMGTYYEYLDRIAGGENVSGDQMVNDLQSKLEAIGVSGTVASSAADNVAEGTPASTQQTIDKVI
jgi:hypothetical protein